MPKKEYLGDSVYASFNGFMITLTTENGLAPSNTIHLEPAVVTELMAFIKRTEEEQDRFYSGRTPATKET
jgi:hypothetical protein